MKILVVDDSSAIRTKLSRYLRELGHDVVGQASNGFEGIELYQALKPQVITLDIVMPECDGIRALGEILKIEPNAKVIMVTSAATQSNMVKAKEMGAAAFVVKPFIKEKVQEALDQVSRLSGKAA